MVDYIRGDFALTKFSKRWIALFYGNYIWENNYEYIGTLWFLIALFCTEILFGLVLHISKTRRIRMIITVLISCTGFLVAQLESNYTFRLPWCFDIALVACIFYGCGYFWRDCASDKKVSWVLGIVFVFVGIACGLLNNKYMNCNDYEMVRPDMLCLNFGFVPLFILSGMLCSGGGMIICKNIKHLERFRVINHFGRNSLLIMVIHLYVKSILNSVGGRFGVTNSYVILAVTLAISYILGLIIERFFSPLYKHPIKMRR